jgi:hypothetical protein
MKCAGGATKATLADNRQHGLALATSTSGQKAVDRNFAAGLKPATDTEKQPQPLNIESLRRLFAVSCRIDP